MREKLIVTLCLASLAMAACESDKLKTPRPKPDSREVRDNRTGKFFGESLKLFGDEDIDRGTSQNPGVGVNAYLWRATLDTTSFMPLASADPFGGVIITDWHSKADTPNSRYKLTVYIMGSELRADAIKVSMFKQRQTKNGQWVDEVASPASVQQIENAILTRARELRIASGDF